MKSILFPTANPLYWNFRLMIVCLVVIIPLGLLDERLVMNAHVWIKPIKFSLSSAIYSISLLWILPFLNAKKETISRISWVVTITLVIEIILVFLQAARGIPSHFNVTTPLNMTIFNLMGFTITVLWVTHLVVTIKLIGQKNMAPLFKETLLWGLIIAAYGMIVAFFMTVPRPEQIAEMKNGIFNMSGGHTFGGSENERGLLFLGWNTEAGDMRVSHFIGMHAMQFFSILAYFKIKFNTDKLSSKLNTLVIRGMGIAYLFITVMMTVQALMGESVFKSSILFGSGYLFFSSSIIAGFLYSILPLKFNKLNLTGTKT